MEMLRRHSEVVRPLIDHLRLLVGGPELDTTLARLGLLDDTLSANQGPADGAAANQSAADGAAANQDAGGEVRTNQSAGNGGRASERPGNGGMLKLETEESRRSNHSSSPVPDDADSVSE